MAYLLLYLQILLISRCMLAAPQNNADNFEPEDDRNACKCVPEDECEDGFFINYGVNFLRPKVFGEEDDIDPQDCASDKAWCCPEEKPYVHKCGTRNIKGIFGKVINTDNDETEFGEWPWQAAILIRNDTIPQFLCGGTLIDERHVVTAAHCVNQLHENMDQLVVRLGEWDREFEHEYKLHEDYGVDTIIIHSNFDSARLFNDIALLKLSREVKFEPYIDTVCLPNDGEDFTGANCFVTGWGSKAIESDDYVTVLKKAEVPIIDHKQCQRMLQETQLGRGFRLQSSFLCAGGEEGKDSCKGDGGGPLVCPDANDVYKLVGIVSWGVDCGKGGVPGVYVNVTKYGYWIATYAKKPFEYYLG